jgi:hypothetical protein
MLCVVVASVVQDKEVVEWSEGSALAGPSSRASASCSSDNGSQDSSQSSSYVPSLHGTARSSRYLTHDDVPEAIDGDDISIHATEEMEKYESLYHWEFAHTRIYDVNLPERDGLDEELPTILRTISWGKLYDEPRLGSRLLILAFLMTFETVEKNTKSFVKFRLFENSFGCDLSCFSELLDFSKSCLPESSAIRNFNKVKFSDAISGKSARLRFSDIHNPSLRFLHRWMSFTLIPMVELHSVTTPELRCLFAMVNRVKYTPVANIVDYFKNVHKMSRPIKCTSMVTQITINLGCLKMANLAYIDRDVPDLGLDHFVHAHILREKPNHSLSMMYGRKVIRIPNPGLRLYSSESLIVQFDRMGEACHSFTGPPRTCERGRMEAAQQTMTTP